MLQLMFRVDAERHTFYLRDKTGPLLAVIQCNYNISVPLKPEAEPVMMVKLATNQSIHTTSSS